MCREQSRKWEVHVGVCDRRHPCRPGIVDCLQWESDMRLIDRLLLVATLSVGLISTTRAEDGVIPLDVTGPRPTAEFVVGTHPPVNVIFDTGAGGTVLLPAYAAKLALPNQGSVGVGSPAGGAPRQGYLTTLPSARLGQALITNARAVVVDLGLPLEGISGVVSPNVFAGSLLRFELKKSRAVVVPKSPGTLPQADALPYGGGGHPLPSAMIDVAGVKVEAHIDTGNGRGLALPLELAKRLSLKTPLAPGKEVRMVSSTHRSFTATIAGAVKIGPLTLIDPDVTFVEGVPIANVGFSVLKDLTIVLDPAERRTWLLPSE